MSTGWDSEKLIQPLAADSPCGESLEDTQLLASFDSYRLFGQASPLDPQPDWREIKERSLQALDKSKDIRLLAHLAAALLRTDGLESFFKTLSVASTWLGDYWQHTYPLVDEDAILRKNALNCLADRMAVVDGLRRLPLVSHRQLGAFSLRDIEIASGQVPLPDPDAPRPDEAQINAAFAAAPAEDLATQHRAVGEALAALKAIDDRMRNEGGIMAAPTFDALLAALIPMERILKTQLESRPELGPASPDKTDAGAAESRGATAAVGDIKTRQDAIRALDAVAMFFRKNEPSSPIPLFIERAKRLVAKDFLEVLADIAPDAVPQARAAGGVRDEGE